MSNEKSLLIKIDGDSKELQDEFKRIRKQTENLEKALSTVAKTAAIGFTALTALAGATIKVFADFETGLLGVGKTADLAGKELTSFGKDIQDLSSKLPFSTKELLEISEAAGQLGVKGRDNLLKFTETIAKLGTASDISGAEAATALTRILNVTNENISSIDKLSSVIVALGNNFAASESEIVRMTTEVARATTVFGVSSAEAAALGTALKSVGIQAELGGSVVGRTFREIDQVIRNGGDSFIELSKITGLTGDQLRKTFKEDATAVFTAFVGGLAEVQKSGGNVTKTLAQFNLKGDEISKVLPVIAGNADLLSKAFATAAAEIENATALQTEFERAAGSINVKTKILGNSLRVVSEEIGTRLAPAYLKLIAVTQKALERFRNLDEGTKDTIVNVAKITGVVLGLIAALASAAVAFLVIKAALIAVGIASAPVLIAFAAISAAVVYLTSNMDALGALVTATQAGWELFTNFVTRAVNNLVININELVISMKEMALATLEALPSKLFAERIAKMKASIGELKAVNEGLVSDNKEVTKSFEDIYDAIDAEKLRVKLGEQAAVRAEDMEKEKAEKERQREEEAADQELFNEEELIRREEQILAKQEQDLAEREAALEMRALDAEIIAQERALALIADEKFKNAERLIITKHIAALKKQRDAAATEKQKKESKDRDDRRAAEEKDAKERLDFKKKFNQSSLDAAASLASRLLKSGSALAKGLFLLSKASALKEIAINTWIAASKAWASAPFPFNVPPTAAAAAGGAAQLAAVSAIGAANGALVGDNSATTGGGDKHPFMLERGELVVPRRNFDEVVAATARSRGMASEGASGGGGQQSVTVNIDISDDAAQLITAQQFENSTLGTDRI